ncbi:PD-(D/E)XK motif protein [Pseudomonas chlororaphis]|uniref:PD-(D/E)XK motif protein n=1 Tax=Pseudomonas chlororaphis TaxID=587753 RepID=UPI00215A4456|nr:PD-(D/E)XK motif protein [Pseudomonas chlororaphis]UVE48046.1 PD-(D/E)XK motif protein [Pseudomonas chlororaphis]
MNLLEEIRFGFANLGKSGLMLPINQLPDSAPAWIFTEGPVFGVAVELTDDRLVAEAFTGAQLITVDRIVGGVLRRLLRLESNIQSLRNEFAVICAHMVTPGENDCLRQELLIEPSSWWKKWRHLLGNALSAKSSYGALAELLTIEKLMKQGMEVQWQGPSGGVVDVWTPAAGYEVKATISRYDSCIRVAGQFQLALASTRLLNLIHYRFEPSVSGDSIDAAAQRLIKAGFDAEILARSLALVGFYLGNSALRETFVVLESRLFPVCSDFPRIVPESFLSGSLPAGVVRVEYQVDLAGLVSQPF